MVHKKSGNLGEKYMYLPMRNRWRGGSLNVCSFRGAAIQSVTRGWGGLKKVKKFVTYFRDSPLADSYNEQC